MYIVFVIHSFSHFVVDYEMTLGLSDPYVVLYINDKKVAKTQVIRKTLNPVWNRPIHIESDDLTHVSFSVKDWDLYVLLMTILCVCARARMCASIIEVAC